MSAHLDKDELNAMLSQLEKPNPAVKAAASTGSAPTVKGAASTGSASAVKTSPALKAVAPVKPKGGSRRPPRQPDYKFLVLGGIFLLVAVVYSLSGLFMSNSTDEAALEAGMNPAGRTAANGAQNPGGGSTGGAVSSGGSSSSAGMMAAESALRPKDIWIGQGYEHVPEIIPLAKFQFPPSGKPLQVFCILFSPLDAATERAWSAAGLFAAKRDLSAHIRLVTLNNAQAFEHLLDWRVEGIVTALPKMKNAEPPGVDDELTARK